MRFYLTVYKRWSMEQKLNEKDEILYLHKVFPASQTERAWDIVKRALDAGDSISTVIGSLQSYFSLNTVETFSLQEKFFSFKKQNRSFIRVFEELFDLSWSIAESATTNTTESHQSTTSNLIASKWVT